VLRRRWRYRSEGRTDLDPGCPERLDLPHLRYVWAYPGRHRQRVIDALAAHAPGLPVVRLRSRRAVRRWLGSLSTA